MLISVRFFILDLPTNAFLATVVFLLRNITLVAQALIFGELGVAISMLPCCVEVGTIHHKIKERSLFA